MQPTLPRLPADCSDALVHGRVDLQTGVAVLFAGETVLGASSAGTSTLRLGGAAGDAAAGARVLGGVAAGDAVAGAGCGRGGVGDASSSSTAGCCAHARRQRK